MEKSERTLQERQRSRELQREQQDEEILKRILLWLGAAAILEAFVLLVNRFYFHYRVSEIMLYEKLYHAFGVAQYVGILLCVVCVIWIVSSGKKNSNSGILPFIATALSAALAISCVLFRLTGSAGIELLQVAVPALAVLLLVYYLYQREFFAISLLSSMGILGLWILRAAGSNHIILFYCYLAISLLVLIAALRLTVVLRTNDGILTVKGKQITVFPGETSYSTVLATCALVAVALLLSTVAGAAVAYYAILVIVTWMFMMAVYFTARLM